MVERYSECWKEFLETNLNTPVLISLAKDILPNINYYPQYDNIFNVFNMELNNIKLVIIGQDTYPHNAACGYAFAVSKGTTKPVSLRIIEKELGHEINPSLEDWIEKGVFLLNTALTVEAGKPVPLS